MIYNMEEPTIIRPGPRNMIYRLMMDAESDAPGLDHYDFAAPGSRALCLETGNVYVLNGDREWVVIEWI